MTEKTEYKYADQLASVKAALKLSQNELAAQIGVNPSVISQYFKGDYAGNVDNVEVKILDFLSRVELREGLLAVPYVETSTAKRITDLVKLVHLRRTLGLIYGPAGVGKTWALRDYERRTPSAGYIACTPALCSPKAITLEMLTRININRQGTLLALQGELINKLRGTDYIYILDEAQELSPRALEQVRAIHDATGISIMFSGTLMLYNNFTYQSDKVLAQLYSRVGARRLISEKIPDEDIAAIVSAMIGNKKPIIRELVKRAEHTGGGIRLVVNQLQNAWQMAVVSGDELTLEHVKAAEKLMMV